MSFDAERFTCDANAFSAIILPLYDIIQQLHDRAASYDRSLSLYVLNKIPLADEKIPGFITPEDRRLRTIAINSRAADSLLSIKAGPENCRLCSPTSLQRSSKNNSCKHYHLRMSFVSTRPQMRAPHVSKPNRQPLINAPLH